MDMKNLQAARKSAESALAELHARDVSLRAAHADARGACLTIIQARPPTDVIITNMRQLVDDAAAEFAKVYAGSVLTAFGGHLEEHEDTLRVQASPRLFDTPGFLTFQQLCGLAPDVVKARLEAIILAGADPELALPLEDRAARLRDAKQLVREIEDAHTGLVEACAGFEPAIEMELMPEVKARHDTEARRALRDVEAARLRASAEEAANRKMSTPAAAPRSGVPSPYLTDMRTERAKLGCPLLP